MDFTKKIENISVKEVDFLQEIIQINKIPKLELLCINGILIPKKPKMKLIRYTKKIPPVAAAIPNLKFSVGLINPDLYANNNAASVPKVKNIA